MTREWGSKAHPQKPAVSVWGEKGNKPSMQQVYHGAVMVPHSQQEKRADLEQPAQMKSQGAESGGWLSLLETSSKSAAGGQAPEEETAALTDGPLLCTSVTLSTTTQPDLSTRWKGKEQVIKVHSRANTHQGSSFRPIRAEFFHPWQLSHRFPGAPLSYQEKRTHSNTPVVKSGGIWTWEKWVYIKNDTLPALQSTRIQNLLATIEVSSECLHYRNHFVIERSISKCNWVYIMH